MKTQLAKYDGLDTFGGNSLFDLFFGQFPMSFGNRETGDTVRFQNNNDDIVVEIDVPGFNKDSLEATVGPVREGHYLQVRGTRKVLVSNGTQEETLTKGVTLRQVDADNITTSLQDGVLRVTAPRLKKLSTEGVKKLIIL